MKIVNRKIKDLIGAEYNPRELTKDQYKQLKDSLLRFGVVDPVIVNKHPERDNIIIGGHQRSKVWGDMGNESIPTVELSLTLDKEKELNVRLNKNTGQFDMDMLANNFDTEDLIEWGFSEGELVGFDDVDLEAEEDEFDVPDGGIETDIVLGDLFEIGEHRLLCGDSTDSDTVAKLMNGEKADMVFTDPPYGMNLDTDYSKLKGTEKSPNAKGYKWDKVIGDNKEFDFLTCYALFEYVKEQFWWGADYYFNQLPIGGGLFVWQKRDKADSEMIGNDFEICWSKQRHKKATFWKRWVGFDSIEKGDKRVHPTQKPIDLASWFIKDWSLEKNIIIDLFLGSGSFMVAAHQLKRKCYGMELDPKYCQVIIDRMIKLDENLVVKLNGKPYEKELVSL